jgi:tetratricopeptide (TPR) repeat protein
MKPVCGDNCRVTGEEFMSTDLGDMIAACENANQLNAKGVEQLRAGDLGGALTSFTQGIELIKDFPGHPLVKQAGAALFGNFAQLFMRVGKPNEAIPLLQQQLKLADEVGDRKSYSNALNSLGLCHLQRGDDKAAEQLFEQRLAIAKEIKDTQGQGNTLNNLATIYMNRKQYGPARKLLQQRIELARVINDRRGEATGLMNLGKMHQELSQRAEAEKTLKQALTLMQADGDPRASKVEQMIAAL